MVFNYSVEVPSDNNIQKSNYISTTKYNLLTFLPLSLLMQFKRYANIYFLIIAIAQSISIISPLNPYSAILPLCFVLCLSMTRQGYQDVKRWKSDQQNNSNVTQQCKSKDNFEKIEWKNVKPGNYIRIQDNQTIPADILILFCQNQQGISYVETSSLDGEKNLKPRISVPSTQLIYNPNQQLPDFNQSTLTIICTEPNANIQQFQGVFQGKLYNTKLKYNINKKNMILRGCKLKNSGWIIGVVIYTGSQTTLIMNSSQPRIKTSNIQNMINKIILCIFAFQALCCITCALYRYLQCQNYYSFELLLHHANQSVNCVELAFISLGSYLILCSTFIPISLVVTLEFVKVFQGFQMSNDIEMYCNLKDRKTECHTVSINEQLGQIEYILTDKTGTLTCNKMQFKNIIVGNQIYGDQIKLSQIGGDGINFDYSKLSHRFNLNLQDSYVGSSFNDKNLQFSLSSNTVENNDQKKHIEMIFFMITTCHECLKNNGKFQGPSPDQVALLQAAENIGFSFQSISNRIITVQYAQQIYKFQLLKIIQFDSDRKRMTVVIQKGDSLVVFTKGADSAIKPILRKNQLHLKYINDQTIQMTKTGLRSLWFAKKTLPLDCKVDQMSDQQFQSNLDLIGATGIQDKLQDYVPETIYALREGGIKFIMLTGDKLETAQNIARSCRLIENSMLISSQQKLKYCVEDIENNIQMGLNTDFSPVIDGSVINLNAHQKQILKILPHVNSIVLSRMTPGQKADVVKMVKKLGKLTLAIGDGANDVNMIMQADVGVGIFGQEGTRAAQVSDYAIGQFCLLWKLMLYYGRLNYMRIAQMILYFFYKNMVFTIVQFAYVFYNLGSGFSFWLSWSITLYNLVFTCIPVLIRAVYEVDVNIRTNKRTFHEISQGIHQKQILYSYYPKMYLISQKNQLFTYLIFLEWFALGISQGIICFMITLYTIGDASDFSGIDSYQSSFYFVEISAYTSVIIVVTLKLAINVKEWSIALFLGFLIPSLGAYIGYTFLSIEIQENVISSSTRDLIKMPSFYLAQLLCVLGMFAFDVFLFSLQATKKNFQNYLKFKTIENKRLSENNLKTFIMEMQYKS